MKRESGVLFASSGFVESCTLVESDETNTSCELVESGETKVSCDVVEFCVSVEFCTLVESCAYDRTAKSSTAMNGLALIRNMALFCLFI